MQAGVAGSDGRVALLVIAPRLAARSTLDQALHRAPSVAVPIAAVPDMACSHIHAEPANQQEFLLGAVILNLGNGDAAVLGRLLRGRR